MANIEIRPVEQTDYRPSMKYRVMIPLTGTIGAAFAPLGTHVKEPHVIGWGQTPEGALKDAYETMGKLAIYTPLPEATSELPPPVV